MTTGCRRRFPRYCFALLFIYLPLVSISVRADDLDNDFTFASGLIQLGFPDYADKVVQQVLRLHPDQKDRAKLIQAEILISRRKFADAQELVKTMGADNPKAQAISLALAKGYYAAGDMDKAKQLYNNFFKQYEGRTPSDPDLLRFYQDSAYQFGQMLEQAGDKPGAIKAFGLILSTKPDKEVARRLMAKQADLDVQLAAGGSLDQQDKYLSDAKKLCDTIQWGGVDIWFGQSIITAAHIEIVKGKKDAAQKLLRDNMEILKGIDQLLVEQNLPLSESPMAGARYLLGDLFKEQADGLSKNKDKQTEAMEAYVSALTEYYNVFAKYAESEWAPQAGLKAQQVKDILEGVYKKKVKVDLGTFQSKAAASQFHLADNLYRQKKYKEAVEEYLKILNQFPETESSPAALTSLALCYANLQDKLMVKMVCNYIGERFAGKDPAAIALMTVGKLYLDNKDEPMYTLVYDTYLKYFPKHERAAGVLFTLAGLRRQAGDTVGAEKLYDRIAKNYPKDQFYPKALNQMAWGRFLATNYAGAIQYFINYVQVAQPSPDKAQAQFALADCYRMTGKLAEAMAGYEQLIQWLAPKENPFSTSAADAKKNADVLENAAFQRCYCLGKLKEPAASVPDYRDKAIKGYDQFIAMFPQSKLASRALSGKGTIQLELGKFDIAAKTFDELAAKYPDSEEGKSALFALVRSAMEIKQYDQAKSAFEKMVGNEGKYSPDQFARIGQMMLDAKLYPQAVEAFKRVIGSSTQDKNLLEMSYFGMGRALFEQKKYEDAIKSLEDLMEKYPRSGLFYEAKFTLGSAYREVNRLDDATLALGDVFRYADKPQLINKASFDLGMIQEQQGQKQQALASFLRVALLADPNDPELRPIIEQSLVEAIKLGMDMERYQDVSDCCDQYLKLFPSSDKIETIRKYRGDAKLKASAPPPPAQPPTTAPAPGK